VPRKHQKASAGLGSLTHLSLKHLWMLLTKGFYPYKVLAIAVCFGLGAGGLWWQHSAKWSKSAGQPPLIIGISPDYPPFEFYKHGQMTGLDVELAHLLSKELGVPVQLQAMSFSMIFISLSGGLIDLGISCIVATPERSQHFDFSTPYFQESMAIVWKKPRSSVGLQDLPGLRIGCQLGTTMQTWLKSRFPTARVQAMENNLHVIEALRAGHVDAALLESLQADTFCAKDAALDQGKIQEKELEGFASAFSIALPKNSPWTQRVNAALVKLKNAGILDQLVKKWTSLKAL
jgi:polar amino acid transport system substrate-binding protein